MNFAQNLYTGTTHVTHDPIEMAGKFPVGRVTTLCGRFGRVTGFGVRAWSNRYLPDRACKRCAALAKVDA